MNTYRLALIGFGNVGRALVQAIHDHSSTYEKTFGLKLIVTAVSDALKGTVYHAEGLHLPSLLESTNSLKGIAATTAHPSHSSACRCDGCNECYYLHDRFSWSDDSHRCGCRT